MASPTKGLNGKDAKVKQQQQDDVFTQEDPDPVINSPDDHPSSPETPEVSPSFDWDGFEKRYEQALRESDALEHEILKDAEGLSKYFKSWASAASAHDDERAVKRLQTRARFVNISESKMLQKQQHYEDVVRAFESALALLKSR